MRVLSEAEHRIDRLPFPICLFEFAPDAIVEIIVGMRSARSLISEIQSLAASLPRVQLFVAREDADCYALVIDRMS